MRYTSRRGFWAPDGLLELAIGAVLLGLSVPPFLRALSLDGNGFGKWGFLLLFGFIGLLGLAGCIFGIYQFYRQSHPREPKQ